MTSKKQSTKTETKSLPRFMAYALPRAQEDKEIRIKAFDTFVLHDVPLLSSASFLDYDGLVLFAGAFEYIKKDSSGILYHTFCACSPDLDLREREFFSMVEQGKPVIFLVPNMVTVPPHSFRHVHVDPRTDLFRRIAGKIGLQYFHGDEPESPIESVVPEFREYVRRYGIGYVKFQWNLEQKSYFSPLCHIERAVFGLVAYEKVFFLPSADSRTANIEPMLTTAITALVNYRHRLSTQIPLWVSAFAFDREVALRNELEETQRKALLLEGQIGRYTALKGLLCYRSDPLVRVVHVILKEFCDIALTVNEQFIEDATLRDDAGNILAVFEIKGVNPNFRREDVNQVDSHRERLGLPSTIPGVLIMNTLMKNVDSLKDKDIAPDHKIIQKAVAENVLLIRTLDLLRYANAVDKGTIDKAEFRKTILSKSGWLSMDCDVPTIVTG